MGETTAELKYNQLNNIGDENSDATKGRQSQYFNGSSCVCVCVCACESDV